jgi:rhodanese-related sulfurtransferase
VAFVPQAKVGIVVLSNLNETKLPESLAFRFFDMYFGNPERDWSKEAFDKDAKAAEKAASEEPVRPKLPLHARPLYKYCGEYANDIFGKVRVSKKGEEIALVIGPKDTAIGLSHWDRDTFMGSWEYFCVGEGTGPVRFSMGPDGEPSGMTIEMLDADGCGTFEKLPSASPPAAYKARKPEATVSFDKCYNEAPLKDGVREITYLKFLQLCASGEKIIVVDVLSPDDYNTGHIPGAISLPVKMINELSAKSKIPPGSAVIVYCLDSHCPYSREAAQKLSGYGYKVLAYKGGLDEWQQKGQKLVR